MKICLTTLSENTACPGAFLAEWGLSILVEIIAHPNIWAAKYVHQQGKADSYIGIPFQRQELESLGTSINLP